MSLLFLFFISDSLYLIFYETVYLDFIFENLDRIVYAR